MTKKNRIIKALACAFLVSVPAYALANQTELPAESTFEITRDTLPVEMASLAWLEQDKEQLAQLAYEYAYSIDEAYKYFYQTVIKEEYPLNRFQNIRVLADDTYTAHPTINNDTLHLMGWMDLGAEPVIITIPDHDEDRY